MSAAEHQSSNSSSQSAKPPLRKPPQRPSLVKPPSRSPEESAQEVIVTVATPEEEAPKTIAKSTPVVEASPPPEETPKPVPALHPISVPSEPMQYRAIGLVRGVYAPEEEQLNRGNLIAEDGTKIDSVLLGRVTSLIKKHIDLAASHLWVVYPRTRQADEERASEATEVETDLHLQIVGVWEPETLGMPGENPGAADEASTAEATDQADEVGVPDTDDGELAAEAEAEAEAEAVVDEPAMLEAEEEASSPPEEVSAPEADAEPETDAELDSEADVAIEEPITDSNNEASITEAISTEITEAISTEAVASESSSESTDAETTDNSQVKAEVAELPSENYFSIRGEILKCDEGSNQILVKILQGAKQPNKTQKAFKLHVTGQISGKTVGYFWELDVERQGKQLVLLEGHTIGIVPPKKRKKSMKKRGPGGPGGRRPSNQGPRRRRGAPQTKEKPRIRPSAPVKSNPL
ncbi:MAG: hypothetical protein AAGE59_10765 [Cyanobacteria bacterium P01_F01_bin.86]